MTFSLLSTDLDGTLLGNPESTARFNAVWSSFGKGNDGSAQCPRLVYNSGRLVDDLLQLIADRVLIAPDFLIGGVGTQIYDVKAGKLLDEYDAEISYGWKLASVREVLAATPGVTTQPDVFQHACKSSWFLENANAAQLADIRARLAAAHVSATLVYSSQRDLDILPAHASKGAALAWLCGRLSIPMTDVIVAGDTGNDASMFQLSGARGIIVGNANPELFRATVDIATFTSSLVLADGLLDGLRYYGVITSPPPSAHKTAAPAHKLPSAYQLLFTGAKLGSLTKDERSFLITAYERAIIALRKNITPLGFSACALDENVVTGTDANYRSIWARDGAMTVIYSLDLDDPDIRAAQRATLDTLLNATSPTGQIPANINIDSRLPDYGGVGNICSIDSGLWVIIAAYNYYAQTQDIDFLRTHAQRLDAAMRWLAAHDSNNDGLLEIPEAGDWTDLFGRSYNILYDEVLWYRTNVCYGRILEFLGDFDRATDYLRWSQHIRNRVLETFWPATAITPATTATMPPFPLGIGAATPQPPASAPHADARNPHASQNRFAELQYSLGDTHYLLSEITPFSFNWRCDTYANILAFLMHLLDIDRARTAFRYMWGVGINTPWPITNLYPVVQAGDPDWRPYYTVNLLNLPHHYHNGGIWPFIGGMWVRFIHQLGFHEVACRELVQLAKLNQLGRAHEWEFNEWAHGVTGRPMGKAFQAWSAASFIKACHELETTPAPRSGD